MRYDFKIVTVGVALLQIIASNLHGMDLYVRRVDHMSLIRNSVLDEAFRYFLRHSGNLDSGVSTARDILSVDCGTGGFERYCASLTPLAKFHCLDSSVENIVKAKRQNLIDKTENICFTRLDITENELLNRFDIVFSGMSCHAIDDKWTYFSCMRNHMKKNGRMLIIGIDQGSRKTLLFEAVDSTIKKPEYSPFCSLVKDPLGNLADPILLRHFDKASCQKICKDLDLKIIFLEEYIYMHKLMLSNDCAAVIAARIVQIPIAKVLPEALLKKFTHDVIAYYLSRVQLDNGFIPYELPVLALCAAKA